MGRPLRTPVMVVAPLAIVVAAPFVVTDNFYMHLLVISGIFAIAVTGLNLVMGYSGLLSLGHHAFFGIGAYGSALAQEAGLPLLLAVLVGTVVAGAASLVTALILLRLRAAFFVIATIAFSEIVRAIALNWVSLTNGPMGMTGVAPLSLFGIDLSEARMAWYLVVAALAAVVAIVRWLLHSPMGTEMVAMRESENVARSLGIDTGQLALRSVVIGSAMAGLAGALYVHYLQFASPDVFSFSVMITMVVMVLGGGMGTLLGPLLGAVVFTGGPELLRAGDDYRLIIYGVIIVLLVRFMPEGVWGRVLRRLGRGDRPVEPMDPGADDEGRVGLPEMSS